MASSSAASVSGATLKCRPKLADHFEKHVRCRPTSGEAQCPARKRCFETKPGLRLHRMKMKRRTGDKKDQPARVFNCTTCGKSSSSRQYHCAISAKCLPTTGVAQCPSCKRWVDSGRTIKAYWNMSRDQTTQLSTTFVCATCAKVFRYRACLAKHYDKQVSCRPTAEERTLTPTASNALELNSNNSLEECKKVKGLRPFTHSVSGAIVRQRVSHLSQDIHERQRLANSSQTLRHATLKQELTQMCLELMPMLDRTCV